MSAVLRVVDCIEGLQGLAAESIDVVVTSPPYNIGIAYGRHLDRMPRGDYCKWMLEIARGIQRVLKADGSLFLNVGNIPSDQWIAHDVAREFGKAFDLQNTIHWIKSIAGLPNGEAYGHFKPINSPRFLNDCHEYVFHFRRIGQKAAVDRLALGVPHKDPSNAKRWASGSSVRCRGNVWYVPYTTIRSKSERPHPATFPPDLAAMCIKLHGLRESPPLLVLDPFMGSGSTAVAALRLGADVIGFDIDPEYVAMATARVSNETGKA